MAAERPDDRSRRSGWLGIDPVTARVAWTILLVGAGLALVYVLRHVLLLLAFSVFFAYLIFPLVTAAERWIPGFRSRARALALVYLLLIAALALGGAPLGPRVGEEVRGLAERLPEIARQLSSGAIVSETLQRHGIGAELTSHVASTLRAHAGEILASAQGATVGVLKWLSGAWVIILIPIFAFFILKDGEAFMARGTALLGRRQHRERWQAIIQDLHHLLGEYMRALVLLSLITFVVWSMVFLVAGLPYPIMLAVIGGVLEVLPLVGPVVAGVIVLSVTAFTGYGHTLALLIFIVGWRFVQDYVSVPLVMGRGIELHPALIIFGVIAGGELAGPAGMFLSVPVIASLRIVWRHAGPDGAGRT
jgi:predicted PurR-regulated permease PerM